MAASDANGAMETIAVAVGLLAVDAALIVAHLRERASRPTILEDSDRRYYQHRDIRRGSGAVLMAIAAVLMTAAAWLETRGNLAASYIALWIGVMALVAAMLGLALLDWVANRRFAARHRRQLVEERDRLVAEAAREARRRRRIRRNGPADPSSN